MWWANARVRVILDADVGGLPQVCASVGAGLARWTPLPRVEWTAETDHNVCVTCTDRSLVVRWLWFVGDVSWTWMVLDREVPDAP